MEENTNINSSIGSQTSSPPVSSSTPTQSPPTPHKKSKLLIILIAVIVLFILVAGISGAFYVFNSSKTLPTPTPSQNLEPTPTPDPTASWKTYEGNGFSFKYPASSKILPNGNEISILYDKTNLGFEPPRLVIRTLPDNRPNITLTPTSAESFTTNNGENYIEFTSDSQTIYANCISHSKEQKVIDFCNQILSTFTFE